MAFDQITKKDWYSILGANPSASMSDLKQKYQKLVLMYHPDKQSADVPAGTVEECIQKFMEIDQAWKILGNEETKKEYDLQRRGRYLGRGTTAHWQLFEAQSEPFMGSIFQHLHHVIIAFFTTPLGSLFLIMPYS
uniref:DnaJ heat shock protein family (Hsp40) member C24 n=1 Tax=Rhinolophus ferrumequinum TaxID=59479 RepID=A0A671E9Y8_RHIFE